MLPKPQEAEYRGLTLAEMRALVRKGCGGLDAADMPDDEVDRYLNMSYWALEARFPFKEKECRVEFACTVGENMYLVPGNNPTTNLLDLEAIQSVSVVDRYGTVHPLARMTQAHWDAVADRLRTEADLSADNEDSFGLPARYVRMDETIILHPTPDYAYIIRVYFLKTLQALVSGAVEELNLPREWNEIVVEGAISRAHFYMQDYNLAQQSESMYLAKLNSAVPVANKEERDSRYARLVVQWDDPHPNFDDGGTY